MTGFYNYTDDKILSWFNTENVWVNKNIGGSESQGVEISGAWHWSENLTLTANYTYNRAVIDENPSNAAQEGNDLPFSPRHKANAGLTYKERDNYTIGLFARYLSRQYTNDDNKRTNAGGADLMMKESFVLDIKAAKQIPAPWKGVKRMVLSLSIDNLFNEDYRTFYMYEDPGTVFCAELGFSF